MALRIARSQQQEDAQRCVEANDHRQVMGMTMSPSPAGRPNDAQWINTKDKNQAAGNQGRAKQPVSIHVAILPLRFLSPFLFFVEATPSEVRRSPLAWRGLRATGQSAAIPDRADWGSGPARA